jgi:hypothetical protein
VATLKADIEAWHAAGTETAKPSLGVLRKRWNTVKGDVCVNAETGAVWWPECSKEAYADGIRGVVDAYWNWQTSRAGKRAGKRVGFPRCKRKGRDADRVCFTTGAMRVEPDRRHLTLPVIGTVRTHENTRRIERLIRAGRARVLAISVRRNGTRLDASVRVLVQRPSNAALRCLVRGWVSMSGCVCLPRWPTAMDRSSSGYPTRVRCTRRSKSCVTCLGGNPAVAWALAAISKQAARFPGFTAGWPTFAAITSSV